MLRHIAAEVFQLEYAGDYLFNLGVGYMMIIVMINYVTKCFSEYVASIACT